MNSANDAIVFGLEASRKLVVRFVDDLTPPEMLHRPTAAANCAAWLVGHLILVERNALKAAGVAAEELPPLPDGFEKRFSRDEGCPQAAEFGETATLLPMFLHHRELLMARVRQLTPEQLARPREKPHPMFTTVGEMLQFIGTVHTSMHAGQISTIRRTLGKPPVV